MAAKPRTTVRRSLAGLFLAWAACFLSAFLFVDSATARDPRVQPSREVHFQSGQFELDCPLGTVATGGGGLVLSGGTQDPDGKIARSQPVFGPTGVPSGWILNTVDADETLIEVICARSSYVPDATVAQAFGTSPHFQVGCPPHQVALGGGAGADDPTQEFLAKDQPMLNSSGAPVGWKGNLVGGSRTGTVFAVCMPRGTAPPLMVVTDSDPPPIPQDPYNAFCPTHWLATGVGAEADFPLTSHITLVSSFRSRKSPFKPLGAQALLYANTGDPSTGTAYAVCAG